MEIVDKGGRAPHVERTPDDLWVLLVFGTGAERDRVTVVGPYQNRQFWRISRLQRELRLKSIDSVIVRAMPRWEFEHAMDEDDLVQYGYAARYRLAAGEDVEAPPEQQTPAPDVEAVRGFGAILGTLARQAGAKIHWPKLADDKQDGA